jgi:hypothetical protein
VHGFGVPFSLFAGDWMQATYASLGLGTHRPWYKTRRCLLAMLVTYLPMAVLAWRQGLVEPAISPTNFFADFAAYACFLVGLPLFLLAEVVIDASTRDAALDFVRCGVVRREDVAELDRVHETLRRWRESRLPDYICVAIAYVLSVSILVPEFGQDALPTWHVTGDESSRRLTAAGCWTFLFAIPLLNYVWLRLIWKTWLWIYYLYHVSSLRLDLHATHPDLMGGIGFISEAQGRFALLILAYGISNVAAPVGYQIVVLNYELSITPVWAPIVGFIVGAPLLFTLPLFMFTKQLFRTKRRALSAYRERAVEQVRRMEKAWLYDERPESPAEDLRQLAPQAALDTLHTRIHHMRVVPFDLRSFAQLVGSTLGSMATLLPLLHAKGEIKEWIEVLSKIFGHLGGGAH